MSPNVIAASCHQRTGWSITSRTGADSDAASSGASGGCGVKKACCPEDTPAGAVTPAAAVNPAVTPGCGCLKWVANHAACRSTAGRANAGG